MNKESTTEQGWEERFNNFYNHLLVKFGSNISDFSDGYKSKFALFIENEIQEAYKRGVKGRAEAAIEAYNKGLEAGRLQTLQEVEGVIGGTTALLEKNETTEHALGRSSEKHRILTSLQAMKGDLLK